MTKKGPVLTKLWTLSTETNVFYIGAVYTMYIVIFLYIFVI